MNTDRQRNIKTQRKRNTETEIDREIERWRKDTHSGIEKENKKTTKFASNKLGWQEKSESFFGDHFNYLLVRALQPSKRLVPRLKRNRLL
jgi:hypothetical protein